MELDIIELLISEYAEAISNVLSFGLKNITLPLMNSLS